MADDDLITVLDVSLRGAAIALFLIIAVAVLRQGRARPAAWLGAALAIGAAAYAFCSAPGHPGHHSAAWFAPLLAICAGNAVVFWLFTRAVFDDSFRPRAWHGLLWFALAVCPVVAAFSVPGFTVMRPVEIGGRIVPVAFVLLALAQTVTGWRGDLVEGRRRLRLFIIAAVAFQTTISATVDLSLGPEHVPPELHLVNAGALLVIAVVIAVVLLQANLETVLAAPVVVPPAAGAGTAAEEPVDSRLLARLEQL